MARDTMSLVEQLRNAAGDGDLDFLREGVHFFLEHPCSDSVFVYSARSHRLTSQIEPMVSGLAGTSSSRRGRVASGEGVWAAAE